MEKVEVNVNGFPLDGVIKVDFNALKGCLLLHFADGTVSEVYLKNAKK